MPTTVAVICEYNPFHAGHIHHFQTIRGDFGPDTRIVCVMSGNYVQRGVPAMIDKYARAECAVKGSADLVLELPFPFSVQGADFFARSGVRLVSGIGVPNVLSFGCEINDGLLLWKFTNLLQNDEFHSKIKELNADKGTRGLGYAKKRETVLRSMMPEADPALFSAPNLQLALGYLRAIEETGASLAPHIVERTVSHSDSQPANGHLSAQEIRRRFLANEEIPASALPEFSRLLLEEAKNQGELVFDTYLLGQAMIASFRLFPPTPDSPESNKELADRITHAARRASDYDELTDAVRTATYTSARIRRVLLHSFFRTDPELYRQPPLFTQVLAMNKTGEQILRDIRKNSDFPILTKPSDLSELTPEAKKQALFSQKADSLYPLFRENHREGDIFIRKTPFRLP